MFSTRKPYISSFNSQVLAEAPFSMVSFLDVCAGEEDLTLLRARHPFSDFNQTGNALHLVSAIIRIPMNPTMRATIPAVPRYGSNTLSPSIIIIIDANNSRMAPAIRRIKKGTILKANFTVLSFNRTTACPLGRHAQSSNRLR